MKLATQIYYLLLVLWFLGLSVALFVRSMIAFCDSEGLWQVMVFGGAAAGFSCSADLAYRKGEKAFEEDEKT